MNRSHGRLINTLGWVARGGVLNLPRCALCSLAPPRRALSRQNRDGERTHTSNRPPKTNQLPNQQMRHRGCLHLRQNKRVDEGA